MTKQKILEYLKKKDTCVLATCQNNKTEAATIKYAVDDNFVFYFITYKSYRKHKNLMKNKNVSVVVGFEMPTVQVDGKAEFLKPQEIELIRPFMLEKVPDLEPFLKMKGTVYLKIKPKYLKMTSMDKGKEKIEQIKF
ncbi:pyridoxamine 5'-phosphate oxidase family protein [Candidatus Woesearchaeota archaeon]|nr:pyridoxamine 5'-phosphate oxidase family protein [Candidatus Woesearchaeota archaeon]